MSGYKFDHKKRGQAVVIVNKLFWGESAPPERRGAERDYRKMTTMFRNLDFYVSKKTRMNLTKDEMLKTIRKACENKTRNEQSDCFVLVISTHGTELKISSRKGLPLQATEYRHAVMASDSKLVYVDEILDMFKYNPDDVNGLNGKPKLVFVQACRSTKEYSQYDPGLVVPAPPLSNAPSGRQGDEKDDPDSASSFKAEDEDKSETEEEEFTDDNTTEYIDIYADDIVWHSDAEEDSEDSEDSEETAGDSSGHAGENNADSRSSNERGDRDIDEEDAGGSADSGNVPPLPFDIVTLNCPKDCLIFYPVQPHKTSLRNPREGSYLLQYLSANENVAILQEKGLMAYLTAVTSDVSNFEYWPDKQQYPKLAKDAPYKMSATIVHRLVDNVIFKEKEKDSRMAVFLKWLQTCVNKVEFP